MSFNGILVAKLEVLDRVLAELRTLPVLTEDDLRKNWERKRAIERNLQLLVEVVVDVCQRILSLKQQTPASSGAQAVARCQELGVITNQVPYDRIVQFRNFIVHRYDSIDSSILLDVLHNRLRDFETFRDEVLRYGKAQS